jgi:hypothetical protein
MHEFTLLLCKNRDVTSGIGADSATSGLFAPTIQTDVQTIAQPAAGRVRDANFGDFNR